MAATAMGTAMVAMAATDTARGLLSLGTAMAAMAATATGTAMVAMAATDTARGLLSLGTAMAAMAATDTDMAMATATTVEHHRRCHLNLQTYKCPCICDQLRVLNYAHKKKYCSFRSQVHFRTLV